MLQILLGHSYRLEILKQFQWVALNEIKNKRKKINAIAKLATIIFFHRWKTSKSSWSGKVVSKQLRRPIELCCCQVLECWDRLKIDGIEQRCTCIWVHSDSKATKLVAVFRIFWQINKILIWANFRSQNALKL